MLMKLLTLLRAWKSRFIFMTLIILSPKSRGWLYGTSCSSVTTFTVLQDVLQDATNAAEF